MFPLLTPFKDLAAVDFSFPRSADNMQLFLDAVCSIGYLVLAAVMVRRRYPPVLWLLTLGWVLMPLASGSTVSMGRFGCVMFPMFFLLAEMCEDRDVERFVVFSFAFFLSLYNLAFANWYWAG